MALGGKLGKVFGAIGSGLSFIPGPWSAIGVALSAVGSVTQQASAVKERKEAEREREEQTNTPQQTEQQPDNSRPEAAQLNTEVTAQPPSRGIFQPGATSLGNYQLQMDQEIASMLIRDSGGLYDN